MTKSSSKVRFLNFLGITRGAGRIISGEKLLLRKIKAKEIVFLIVASDAGADTVKKFNDKAKSHQIRINNDFSRGELSHAIGMRRTVLGISDPNFAKRLIELQPKIKGQ